MTLWIAQVIGQVFLIGGGFVLGVTMGGDMKGERKE